MVCIAARYDAVLAPAREGWGHPPTHWEKSSAHQYGTQYTYLREQLAQLLR